jgi:hypothetical protein
VVLLVLAETFVFVSFVIVVELVPFDDIKVAFVELPVELVAIVLVAFVELPVIFVKLLPVVLAVALLPAVEFVRLDVLLAVALPL